MWPHGYPISLTTGANGISIPGRPSLFGLSLAAPKAFYWATLVVFLLALVSMAILVASPFGMTQDLLRHFDVGRRYESWLRPGLC